MKTRVLLIMVVFVWIGAGCSQSVSIPWRQIASEFISYFAGKEILDPIFYPDKSKEERERLREELGKELFNHIWADFGEHCEKNENLDSCKRRISESLREWTDLYTEEFVFLYNKCQEEALHKKYHKIDIIKNFESAKNCVISKDSRYSTLFELSEKIKNY